MSKRTRLRKPGSRQKKVRDGLPFIVIVSIGALAVVSYFAGYVLVPDAHPLHWLLALVGGLAGWGVGELYYRTRGDII
jgi:hypothetical protein